VPLPLGKLVVYANSITRTETDPKGEETEREIPYMKGYTVFNAGQCDGLPAPERGGLPCSSVEASVMLVERRGQVIAVELGPTGLHREEPEGSAEGGSLRAVTRAV
jgi:hypothetical protein